MSYLTNHLKTPLLIFGLFTCLYSPIANAANEDVDHVLTLQECRNRALGKSYIMAPAPYDIPFADPCSTTRAHPSGTRFHPSQRITKIYACKPTLSAYTLYVSDHYVYNYALAEKKVIRAGSLESCWAHPYISSRTMTFNTYCSRTRLLSHLSTTAVTQFSISSTGDITYVPAQELIQNYSMPNSSNCNNTPTGTIGPVPSPLTVDQVKQPWMNIQTGPEA